MILYEVNAEIGREWAQDYLMWLGPHIEEILKQPGFLSAKVFEEYSEEKTDSAKFTVHYVLKEKSDLDNYLKGAAKRFRAEAIEKFGQKLVVNRRHCILRESF